jgi:hypothetical protein
MTTLGADAPTAAREGLVRGIVLAVPVAALAAGAAASLFDLRLGLVATVFVIGWTKLVGL